MKIALEIALKIALEKISLGARSHGFFKILFIMNLDLIKNGIHVNKVFPLSKEEDVKVVELFGNEFSGYHYFSAHLLYTFLHISQGNQRESFLANIILYFHRSTISRLFFSAST